MKIEERSVIFLVTMINNCRLCIEPRVMCSYGCRQRRYNSELNVASASIEASVSARRRACLACDGDADVSSADCEHKIIEETAAVVAHTRLVTLLPQHNAW